MSDTKGDSVDIRIELPMPLDIAATLIKVIGLTYPGTMIKDGKGERRSDSRMVLSIPERDRHKSEKKAEKYFKAKAYLDAMADSVVTNIGPGGISVGLPQYMSQLLVEMVRASFAEYPDAPNYLESTVYDRETHAHYVVICARSEGQTPHALRQKAEEDRLRLEEFLVDHGFVIDHEFVGVAGHPDDDECTHRSDGTDETYCGLPASDHVLGMAGG